jgi:hypothetical protein
MTGGPKETAGTAGAGDNKLKYNNIAQTIYR